MKVLLLSTYDSGGGAARATYRILKAIQKAGVSAKMMVRTKTTNDQTVLKYHNKLRDTFLPLIRQLDALPLRFYLKRKKNFWNLGLVPNGDLLKQINRYKPDILQLHWISEGFLPISVLGKINVPIIWRLSDSWAFTGGCHIPYECKNYTLSCGKCPQLNSTNPNDLSHAILKWKEKNWKNSNITIVAPSNWMGQCAKESTLFKNRNVVVIPPGINMNIFKPADKAKVRVTLNLPIEKKIICFAAVNIAGDKNKGFDLLCQALYKLKERTNSDDIEIVVMGGSMPPDPPDFGFKAHYVGRINEEEKLALYYSAADVFVMPSLMENSPNTVIESLACGVPVVAFAAGGTLDMVNHCSNGYLVSPYSTNELATGIEWVFNQNASAYENLSLKAREHAKQNFDIDLVGLRYKNLYQTVLAENNEQVSFSV